MYVMRSSRKQQDKDPNQEKTALLADEEQKEDEFLRGHQREKHKQSDLLQEAEPSFWGGKPPSYPLRPLQGGYPKGASACAGPIFL